MIILPTHNPKGETARCANLERFCKAYVNTGATEPVKLIIDEDDHSFDHMEFPKTFSVMRIPAGLCSTKRENLVFEKYPNEPYYGIMADDVEPLTPHWDTLMKAAAGEWNMAYCADGIMNEKLATHPFLGGELVRAQGYIDEPSVHDWYGDNCRMDVACALGIQKYVREVKFMHHHFLNGKAKKDATYAKQWDHNHDSYLYQQWLHFGGFKDAVARIRKAMDAKVLPA